MPSKRSRTKRKKRVDHSGSSSRVHVYPGIMIFMVWALAIFGLVTIYNVSSFSALIDFDDKYYYVKEQFQWLVVGGIGMLFFSFFNYRRLHALALPLLIGSIVLLIAVFLPGLGVNTLGASRWLNLGFVSFQPVELVKLAMIVYLSAWLSNTEKNKLTSFLLLIGIIILPVIAQPDLGSATVLVTIAMGMYFLSGAPLWHFGALVPGVLVALLFFSVSASYRMQRVLTFLNPSSDPQGASYHVRQILIAIGSGGVFGLGLGKSRQKYAYLPEVTTDSIFAVISEELGLIGSTVIIGILIFIIISAIRITSRAGDRFGYLLAGGITISVSLQILINLGAMVSLVPLTGIPLPFISYGGTNLVVSCAMIGILINIARTANKG